MRWRLVDVSGPSMVPTLRSGDVVLVGHDLRVRTGDVVLARFRDEPERYVIKRADRPADGGWRLLSDNAAAGGDSRTHGAADIEARAVLVWSRRRSGRRRWVPRPVGRDTQRDVQADGTS